MSSKHELVDNKELKLKGFLEIQNSLFHSFRKR